MLPFSIDTKIVFTRVSFAHKKLKLCLLESDLNRGSFRGGGGGALGDGFRGGGGGGLWVFLCTILRYPFW